MAEHPELASEQAYVDRAYECLVSSRDAANRMSTMVEVGRGGTEQARFERDVIWGTMAHRLQQLDLGDRALVFGRIDRKVTDADGAEDTGPANGSSSSADHGGSNGSTNGTAGAGASDATGVVGDGEEIRTEAFYIGRTAVADESQEPIVVDWRAPVAEAFYRATGRDPMGLVRRRHFASRGRTILGIDDELFGEAVRSLDEGEGPVVQGHGALLTALETSRSGKLGDIVGTIQGEQDEIIRAPMPGVLVVQGGPGTGKTVVALHRAAYLLYTHRFPLEGQGVLVIGPNRLFLGYIDQVLPSLGEAGVELAVPADLLVGRPVVAGYDTGVAARVKGDLRMSRVLARAVRHRGMPLRRDLTVGYGLQTLRVDVETSRRIVDGASQGRRKHNSMRRAVESELFAALAASGRGDLDPATVRERLRRAPEVREALEWMWPVLTPEELLNDLFGSRGLLRYAAAGILEDHEWQALLRPRVSDPTTQGWTHDDVPLLDEARALLGPKAKRRRSSDGGVDPDEVRTYGHIVVDEAQDLSPMALRMLNRRSLSGSMTIVGDIAQATGQWAHESWDEILELLPDRREPRRAELTVGYRLPAPNMALAARVLREAAPDLAPPRSIREDGDPPRVVAAADPSPQALVAAVVEAVRVERDAVGVGNVAVICPASLVDQIGEGLAAAGIEHGQATRHGLDTQVTVVPVGLVKGLELDSSVVVEPAAIVDEEAQGMRALYVALTRATKRLAVVHQRPLPPSLAE